MVTVQEEKIILEALEEDGVWRDITTSILVPENSNSEACIIAKKDGVIAGVDIASSVFLSVNSKLSIEKIVADGQEVENGDVIMRVKGSTDAILRAERTALNFLQRMSGIATKTRELCNKVAGMKVKVVDTRKTSPVLRIFEKYAVRAGGGHNHRFGLSDGILVKDNHIKAVGSIGRAVEVLRQNVPHTMKIEVEVNSLEQVRDALEAEADIIMLDNMNVELMKQAVVLIGNKAIVEASGNITANNIYEVARTGVDVISVGALTHSVTALDLSLEIL